MSASEGTGRSIGVAVAEIVVARLPHSDYSDAQAFYRSVGYAGVISREDFVVGAKLQGTWVGLARLSSEQRCLTLRGMQVSEAFQRRRIGSLLLEALGRQIADEECFCLPHEWLAKFYGQIGFDRIADAEAPAFLQDRLRVGREKHASMIVMRRQAARDRTA